MARGDPQIWVEHFDSDDSTDRYERIFPTDTYLVKSITLSVDGDGYISVRPFNRDIPESYGQVLYDEAGGQTHADENLLVNSEYTLQVDFSCNQYGAEGFCYISAIEY
jgi:hypothetical protein